MIASRGLGLILVLCAVASVAACRSQSLGREAALPPPPPHLNGQVLWRIVHDQCVPDQQAQGRPAPCAVVDLHDGVDRGFALLKDRQGAAQYLLLPTTRITGIEDRRLLAPGQVNYFDLAWTYRSLVEARLGRTLPAEDLSVAVNSTYGRSQDLLHLHVDCLAPSTVAFLKARAGAIGPHWSQAPIRLQGHPYFVMRLAGRALSADPFTLLAHSLPGAKGAMGAWTLVLAGAPMGEGGDGLVLLAGRADPQAGDFASGEELQDHDCAVAKLAPQT